MKCLYMILLTFNLFNKILLLFDLEEKKGKKNGHYEIKGAYSSISCLRGDCIL